MDVLESFVFINASLAQTWPFVTDVSKMAMWAAPLAEPVTDEGVRTLDVAQSFDTVLRLPGQPRLHYLVLSLEDGAVETKLDGFLRGLATWHIVPAGRGVIVHSRIKYELADRRWLTLWALGGRWGAALLLNLLLRRLKARVEDTVGSRRFGVPLLVSPYAIVVFAALTGASLGLAGLRVARWFQPRVGRDE